MKILCYTDNKSLDESLLFSKQVNDKRLRLDIKVLECMIARCKISKLNWVNSQSQLADCIQREESVQTYIRLLLVGINK